MTGRAWIRRFGFALIVTGALILIVVGIAMVTNPVGP